MRIVFRQQIKQAVHISLDSAFRNGRPIEFCVFLRFEFLNFPQIFTMNSLNCLRVVELSNTQRKEREDKACCKLIQHFLIGFMYGSLLRMRTFLTIYNNKGCSSQRLVGVTQGDVSLNIV